MAMISNYGVFARLRSEAGQHIICFRNGKARKSGRGLVFWFRPDNTSIAEVPLDDREMTMFVKGRSADFQDVNAQGTLGWRVREPELLADRVDFTIGPRNGRYNGSPIESIETRLAGVASQAVLDFLSHSTIRELLDAGLEPLRARLTEAFAKDPSLSEIGIDVVSVRLANLAPSSELERALQTPTFEALQQKADEATFERRALAVDKERAIAENELANRIELARREKQLISEEAENKRNRAEGEAQAQQVEAEAKAAQIRVVEEAMAEAEQAKMKVYRDLPSNVLFGLAARELANKLQSVEHLNVTPDLLASLMREFGGARLPARVE